MILRRWFLPAALLAYGLALLVPARASAQAGPGSLLVTARSDATAERLRGVEITIEGLPFRWLTDRNGVARIKGLPAGSHNMTARRAGYTTVHTPLSVADGDLGAVALEMPAQAVELESIEVEARRQSRYLDTRGFYQRQRSGPGVFLSREALLQGSPRSFPEALRKASGLSISPGRFSDSQVSIGRNGNRRCALQYVLDGIPAYAFDPNHMSLQDVEGIEVYRGASEIPPQYNTGTALCGVIVIWTRHERQPQG